MQQPISEQEAATSMDSKILKRKKFAPSYLNSKFPILKNDEPYVGIFDGHSVSVTEKKAITNIYKEGNFGKGSLSKSVPTYNTIKDDIPMILTQQQWENILKWKDKAVCAPLNTVDDSHPSVASIQNFFTSCFSSEKRGSWKQWKMNNSVIPELGEKNIEERKSKLSVDKSGIDCGIYGMDKNVPVIDITLNEMVNEILSTKTMRETKNIEKTHILMVLNSEFIENSKLTDNLDFSVLDVKLKNELCCIKETLKLNLSETFFLCFALGCLKITMKNGEESNICGLWKNFCQAEENFIDKYVAYHYYRTLGWTVKSGLKFGGDYLLYKIGPAYYHASYLVRILDKRKKMTWNEFVALNRLVETFNKDLLLLEIIGPDKRNGDNLSSPNYLSQFSVLEISSKRWIPSQERDFQNEE